MIMVFLFTQVGLDIDVPENCVEKVSQFKALALRADQDGHLRQKVWLRQSG
jgi:hypothetical protein